METEPKSIKGLSIEEIYQELYDIAISSTDDMARVKALTLLADYKKYIDNAEERREAMSNLMSAFTKI